MVKQSNIKENQSARPWEDEIISSEDNEQSEIGVSEIDDLLGADMDAPIADTGAVDMGEELGGNTAASDDDFFSENAEDEQVALSADELDNILEDVPADTAAGVETNADALDMGEELGSAAASDDDFFSENAEDEQIALSANELDNILEDVPADTAAGVETNVGDADMGEELGSAAASDDDFFSENAEDEQVALSANELDNILEDVPADTAAGVETNAGALDMGEELGGTAAASDDNFFSENTEDEQVALSANELDNILEDVPADTAAGVETNAGDADIGEELGGGSAASDDDFFSETAEDEQVALSADELDNILEDVPTDTAAGVETNAGALDMGEELGTAAASDDDFFSENTEDEQVALSADELDNILEDVPTVEDQDSLEVPQVPDLNELQPELSVSTADEGSDPQIDDETNIISDDFFKEDLQDDPDLSSADPAGMGEEDPVTETPLSAPAAFGEESPAAGPESGRSVDQEEVKKMVSYLDNLLGELPDHVIKKFAQSEYFNLYKKVMSQLGI